MADGNRDIIGFARNLKWKEDKSQVKLGMEGEDIGPAKLFPSAALNGVSTSLYAELWLSG